MDAVEKVAMHMHRIACGQFHRTPEDLFEEAHPMDRAELRADARALIEAFPQLNPEWEYAEAMPEWGDEASDEPTGWHVGKSFHENPNRALEEGRHLVRRALGPWQEVKR